MTEERLNGLGLLGMLIELSVIPKGTRADVVHACLKSSPIWNNVEKLYLRTNMRVYLCGGDDIFPAQLLKIGNGTLENENGYISVNHTIGRVVNKVEELISTVYPDIFNLSNKSYQWLCERAIISPRNVTAGEINNIILLKFDGHSREYTVIISIDTVASTDDAIHYPQEFLNSHSPSGFPPHKLKLKIGAPLTLLQAVVLIGPAKGEIAFIPRIPMIPSDLPFSFKRLQFPVKVSFAITINKAQVMPKKRENFCQLNITAAVNAVLNDGLSKKAAAKKFGISRSILQFRLKNLNGKTSCGPATVLSDKEEELLQTWIIESCKKGFPRRKEDLQMSVKQFLDINNRHTPFKNNMPGNGWYRAFMQRHPLISIRTSEHVTTASACVSEKDIKKWFSDIHQYLVDEKLDDILQDPTRLFNGDETGFSLCPKTKSILAPKGAKDIYEVAVGNAKENLTVMFTFNAAGDMCHPMVIYNYQRIPQDIVNSVPPNWGIGHSESGWMKSEVFYEFIANIFYPFVVEKGIKFPIILFVDGHKSHLTYQLSELCTSLNIILIALYPNSTRILQPADVAAFRPLKSGWKKGVFEWRKDNNLSTAVTKKDFAPILKKVIDETVKQKL
ncbi:hypothetical protein QTP88_001780 [Uroleucon formosanum]